MITIGYFSLWCSFIFTVFAFSTSTVALLKSQKTLANKSVLIISNSKKHQTSGILNFLQMSRHSIIAQFICILLSSITLWHAIFYHDFSVKYVFEHSAIDMPPIYLFTSFWSALEGSHLLWTLLMSFVCASVVWASKREHGNMTYLPAVYFALSLSLLFMFVLNLTVSDPFARMKTLHPVGKGMNALLQNPYMAIHPPMLFLGYSLLIIPFSYCFAALLKGALSPSWILIIRRSTLIAWTILTIAIFLGGKWAYIVLGWGGYWAWDPVENASFMPWLATTAFLHTILIYERTKKLPRLAVFLGMLTFILTFFGTFLTRSGVISSVHSFAESSIGPSYLLWIVFLFAITLFLIFARGHLLQEKLSFERYQFSKEAILLFTNYFLLFLLVIVLFGTILPLIVEAVSGTKISIQQPFYNAFAPWIGLVLVSILGIGNVAKWKTARIRNPFLLIFIPLLCGFLFGIFFYFFYDFSIKKSIIYFLVLWTVFVLIADFVQRLKSLDWNSKLFLTNHRSYLGALIIHIGFLTAVLGFSGYSQTITKEVYLPFEQTVSFEGFQFTNKGLTYSQKYNEKKITAWIETSLRSPNSTLSAPNDNISSRNLTTGSTLFIQPARTKYTNNEQWFNEVGIYSTIWFDLYLVLVSFDIQDQSIALKMSYNPMVKFVWTSVFVMVLGALIALSARFSFFLKQTSHSKKYPRKTLSAFLILSIAGLTLFSISGLVHAKNTTTLEEVGKELRCPTCLGMSILESDTPQSQAMCSEVQKLIKEGKNKKEIIAYFKERYGSWILREPDSSTILGKTLWLIPIAGLVFGPFVLLWRLYQNSNQKK